MARYCGGAGGPVEAAPKSDSALIGVYIGPVPICALHAEPQATNRAAAQAVLARYSDLNPAPCARKRRRRLLGLAVGRDFARFVQPIVHVAAVVGATVACGPVGAAAASAVVSAAEGCSARQIAQAALLAGAASGLAAATRSITHAAARTAAHATGSAAIAAASGTNPCRAALAVAAASSIAPLVTSSAAGSPWASALAASVVSAAVGAAIRRENLVVAAAAAAAGDATQRIVSTALLRRAHETLLRSADARGDAAGPSTSLRQEQICQLRGADHAPEGFSAPSQTTADRRLAHYTNLTREEAYQVKTLYAELNASAWDPFAVAETASSPNMLSALFTNRALAFQTTLLAAEGRHSEARQFLLSAAHGACFEVATHATHMRIAVLAHRLSNALLLLLYTDPAY